MASAARLRFVFQLLFDRLYTLSYCRAFCAKSLTHSKQLIHWGDSPLSFNTPTKSFLFVRLRFRNMPNSLGMRKIPFVTIKNGWYPESNRCRNAVFALHWSLRVLFAGTLDFKRLAHGAIDGTRQTRHRMQPLREDTPLFIQIRTDMKTQNSAKYGLAAPN